jgi:hypothetical protein
MARTRTGRTRKLRTLRGGGTVSWGFAAPADYRTINNPLAWSSQGCGDSARGAPLQGGGLPGLSQGAGVSLQRGGGGGTHYGFTAGGGLAGGQASYPSNCAPIQSGASGVLNVPNSPLRTEAMAGGRRRKSRSRNKNKKQKQKQKKQTRRR